jgi:hypothetical protein
MSEASEFWRSLEAEAKARESQRKKFKEAAAERMAGTLQTDRELDERDACIATLANSGRWCFELTESIYALLQYGTSYGLDDDKKEDAKERACELMGEFDREAGEWQAAYVTACKLGLAPMLAGESYTASG